MVDDPEHRGGKGQAENHTLRVLQEMRAEMRERFTGMEARFTGIGEQIDGSTLILKVVAGLIHDHEQRIAAIERPQG